MSDKLIIKLTPKEKLTLWSFIGLLLILIITAIVRLSNNIDIYTKDDYYRDHQESSKSYEQWTQDQEDLSKIRNNINQNKW